MENKSGLKPLGRAVLLKTYELKSGVIFLPPSVEQSTVLAEMRAEVVEVGPEAWKEESVPRAKPGDKVLFTRYAGFSAQGTSDGEMYRVVNDRDIFLGIAQEVGNE